MPDWTLVAGPASGTLGTTVLTRAASRKFGFRLDAADTASFTIDGRTAEAGALLELATDIWAYRDHALLFRGRVMPTTDTIDDTTHQVQVTATAYRGILDRRFTQEGDTLSFAGVDQAQIAWSLIQASETRTAGNLGIALGAGFSGGVGATGVVRDRNYDPGAAIGKLVTDLGDVVNGFDWQIDPNRVFQVYYPQRGQTVAQVQLLWGGNVTTVTRTFSPNNFANVVREVGSQTVTPVIAVAAGLALDGRGRWETVLSDPTVVDQATVSEKATEALALRAQPSYAWKATLIPNSWQGPTWLGVGDMTTLLVNSPPRLTDTVIAGRVVQLDVTVDEAATETVDVTLDQAT